MATRLLRDLAFARSGDKGDVSNIGLMARDSRCYEVIRREVTPERLKAHFGSMVKGDILVFDMPNILSLEIVMYGALGGGATRTLRLDQTGKAMATAILRMPVTMDE